MAALPGRASTQQRLAPIRTNHAFEDKSIMPAQKRTATAKTVKTAAKPKAAPQPVAPAPAVESTAAKRQPKKVGLDYAIAVGAATTALGHLTGWL
jgi:hypothetical protein